MAVFLTHQLGPRAIQEMLDDLGFSGSCYTHEGELARTDVAEPGDDDECVEPPTSVDEMIEDWGARYNVKPSRPWSRRRAAVRPAPEVN